MIKRLVLSGSAAAVVAAGLLGLALGAAPLVAAEQTETAAAAAQDETVGHEKVERDATWAKGLDCAECHAKEDSPKTETFSKTHAATAADCALCHDDARLASVHEKVEKGDKVPKRLKKTGVANEVCLQCHQEESLTAATEDCAVLTDANGLVVNPHQLPENDDHAQTTCVDCHKAHKADELDRLAADYCVGCHHENIYECDTCHKD